MKTLLKENDFTVNANSNGYQVQYKGENIGGAGTLPGTYSNRKRHWKHIRDDIKMYSESGQRDINNLLQGAGRPDMKKAIQRIIKQSKNS